MKKGRLDWLYHPWTVIGGMAAGLGLGIYGQNVVPFLRPAGDLYLALLQMCVIPIMASALVTGLGRLVKASQVRRQAIKVFLVFLLFACSIVAISLSVSMAARPFLATDPVTKAKIGKMMIAYEGGPDRQQAGAAIKEIDSRGFAPAAREERGIFDLLQSIVPKNVFSALAAGDNLKILFFFIVLGMMLKFIPEAAGNSIILMFEGIYQVFQRIIKIALYFLPFGLCALVAVEFSSAGFGLLLSFGRLLLVFYLAALAVFLLSSLALWRYSGGSYFSQFKLLGETILISLGSRSSFAAIPSAINGLAKNPGLDARRTNLAVPLGFTLCRYGNIIIYAVAAVYAAQLYDFRFSIAGLLTLSIGIVLTAAAASGAPGILARSMIATVLAPLGIPAGAIVVMLTVLDPAIDPITTLMNAYPNCAASAIIAAEPGGAKIFAEGGASYAEDQR